MITLSRRLRRAAKILVILLVIGAGAVVGVLVAVAYATETVRTHIAKLGGLVANAARFLPPPLPPASKVEQAYWLPQNWSAQDRHWFHHATQGTVTFPIPYSWFVALERPELSLFGSPGLLKDEDYLRRLGFIPSPPSVQGGAPAYGYRGDVPRAPDMPPIERPDEVADNKDGLPVGFARLKSGNDPTTGERYPDHLGLTCAACHTGHIEYRNVSIRFDGGPAMVNLGALESAVGLAIGYTLKIPTRFERFAERVGKADAEWSDKKKLKQALKKNIATMQRLKLDWEDKILSQRKVNHVYEGFGRLDALNRIGNQVFFENMIPPGTDVFPEHLATNFARIDAPVSFPPLWDAPWFLWAQYDASILNEMIRNAGETLGVNAKINLTSDTAERPLYRTSAHLKNVFWFEEMLRGKEHPLAARKFTGLLAPDWKHAEAIFKDDPKWRLDSNKVNAGRELYKQHCVECHRGPVRDPDFDAKWPGLSFWQEVNEDGRKNWVESGELRYFNVVQKPVGAMGTDRQQARVLTERQITIPAVLNLRPVEYLNKEWKCGLPADDGMNKSFALALMAVVDQTVEQWFKDNRISDDWQKKMWGTRDNCQNKLVFSALQVQPASSNRPNTETSPVKSQLGRPAQENPAQPIIVTAPHYRARPLDGVWATAPYLHNGSVPTLHDLLLPQAKRTESFCVGDREFDPVNVGLVVAKPPCKTGLSELNTTGLGNSNKGHSFEGTERNVKNLPPGVVGPELTPTERGALIEYLKML